MPEVILICIGLKKLFSQLHDTRSDGSVAHRKKL